MTGARPNKPTYEQKRDARLALEEAKRAVRFPECTEMRRLAEGARVFGEEDREIAEGFLHSAVHSG